MFEAQADAQEVTRRQQVIATTIADMIDQAKTLLLDAKQIGEDNGQEVSFDQLISDIGGETPWYGSDESLC